MFTFVAARSPELEFKRAMTVCPDVTGILYCLYPLIGVHGSHGEERLPVYTTVPSALQLLLLFIEQPWDKHT